MKQIFYSLYAAVFNICRIFSVRNNRVAFVAPHNGGEKDSLGVMRSYIKNIGGYDIVNISTRDLQLDFSGVKPLVISCLKAAGFFTLKAKALATAKYVFLNDNFMPMANLDFSKEAVVTQLWHAEGAFKKFGLSAPLTDDVADRERKCSEKLTYVVCSSKNVVPVYSEAFGVDEKKILPLGAPRIDLLLAERNVCELRKTFDEIHPECRDKKLILYAPTFRENADADKKLLDNIDMKKFTEQVGDEYKLLIKLHPQINSSKPVEGAVDVTKGHDIGELTLICDMLITDYSSACMDFALLSKPCIFFAFDLEEYEKERSFYFDYESYVPGKVAKTFDEVIGAIKNPLSGEDKLRTFRNFNFDYVDCNNTQRIYNYIFG